VHCRTGDGGGDVLSPGAIAGIAIAGAVFLLMLAAIAGVQRQAKLALLLLVATHLAVTTVDRGTVQCVSAGTTCTENKNKRANG
jgi:type IV secretory pathway VirB3-like protein